MDVSRHTMTLRLLVVGCFWLEMTLWQLSRARYPQKGGGLNDIKPERSFAGLKFKSGIPQMSPGQSSIEADRLYGTMQSKDHLTTDGQMDTDEKTTLTQDQNRPPNGAFAKDG
jgi:hypothetical protein